MILKGAASHLVLVPDMPFYLPEGAVNMPNLALKFYAGMQVVKETLGGVMQDESGQDMVEYAVVMGLIALGATVAMKGLATTIGTAFTSVGTKLTTYTS